MSKEIRITCHAADVLPVDSLVELQGELKTIKRENLDKLKRSILRHGFSAPFFVWRGTDNRILDGHQRLKALREFRDEGYGIPLLPVVYIDADSEEHAKEKLLYITSQYGDFTQKGYVEFTDGLDFTVEDIRFTDGEFFTTYDSAVNDTQDDSAEVNLSEIYEVIIECKSESEAEMEYNRLIELGKTCRLSIL